MLNLTEDATRILFKSNAVNNTRAVVKAVMLD